MILARPPQVGHGELDLAVHRGRPERSRAGSKMSTLLVAAMTRGGDVAA